MVKSHGNAVSGTVALYDGRLKPKYCGIRGSSKLDFSRNSSEVGTKSGSKAFGIIEKTLPERAMSGAKTGPRTCLPLKVATFRLQPLSVSPLLRKLAHPLSANGINLLKRK